MSKLSDLLNPAPLGAAAGTTKQSQSPSSSHRRNESITSPLEALALAATTVPPLQASPTATAPPTTIPPNPYAIKTPFSPPPTATFARPAPANPYATSPPSALGAARAPPSPSPATSSPRLSNSGSVQPVIKTELVDEPVVSPTPATASEHVKSEQALRPTPPPPPLSNSRQNDIDMKDTKPTDVAQPSVENTKVEKKVVTKKGVAKKAGTGDVLRRPAAKKRKLEPESSKDGTPFSQRSGTPVSSRTSKTPARKATPQRGSPQTGSRQGSVSVAAGDDDDYDDQADDIDDDEVFCICRKPDDHTWMIACDGPCEDWFHGRCVKMNQEDAKLIDKYICPNCEADGQGKTMWKPMCRLQGCREPARINGKTPSKYCSDEHGRQFMREKALGANNERRSSGKRRKANKEGIIGEPDQGYDSDDGHQAHLRGGLLRPGELKALATGVKSVSQFKRLGERIATPEATDGDKNQYYPDGQANEDDVKMIDGEGSQDEAQPPLKFLEHEQVALDSISKRKLALNSQLGLLADKDKLLTMVKSRHKSVLDELKRREGVKDICGFDARLTWSEPEFDDWRNSAEGKAALASGVLPPPAQTKKDDEANGDQEAEEIGRGVCKKKRCDRHKTWAKLEQNEINLARSQCWHQMRKLESDEQGIKERAMLRQLEAKA